MARLISRRGRYDACRGGFETRPYGNNERVLEAYSAAAASFFGTGGGTFGLETARPRLRKLSRMS